MSDTSAQPSSNPSQIPAHILYVELATRITTQKLHYRSGDEETAVKSLHSLFGLTRELLAKHPAASDFHMAALVILNNILRPYTARWHGWMTQDRENPGSDGSPSRRFRDEWVRRKFREELRELKPLLQGACKYLHALSLGKPPEDGWLNPPKDSEAYAKLVRECACETPAVSLGKSIPLKIRPQVPLHGANEKGIDLTQNIAWKIKQDESEFIAKRRKEMGFHSKGVENTFGLALSGGGIRSATFCLGVIQSLHRHGIFNQVDYLSTVSGGGYLGTFLSSYLGTKISDDTSAHNNLNSPREKSSTDRVDDVLGRGDDDLAEPTPVRHLRNNSKYLLNGGGWGMVRIAGVFFTGFVASLLPVAS